MPDKNSRFYPIIYVRGYAMTPEDIDRASADPFCGFNIGSTVYRAVADVNRPPRKYIFESPLVRLASDFGYGDVYEDGHDILDPEWQADSDNHLARRSVIIFRYYDEASRLLGKGELPPITQFATRLGELILRVRELCCGWADNKLSEDRFRCYLVAHSMGGLVCRALLQNRELDTQHAARYVDKFFTYATPHNGIDVAGINVPGWLVANDLRNFNREYMAGYLGLSEVYAKTGRVDWLPSATFPGSRVFTMVGSNRLDYEAAFGLSRTFVGHGSDGLVRIENAILCGWEDATDTGPGDPCAKAYAYRSHDGYYGIVNSEEAYQNLVRFLFGDVRIDVWLDLEELRLPAPVQKEADAGREVDALYLFELLASPRGKLWYLSRRVAEEDSVAVVSHQDWVQRRDLNRHLYLSSIFLANSARVNPRRRSLAYNMNFGIRVPDYEVDRMLWINEHYEGRYLFSDSLVVELVPPRSEEEEWKVKYAWQGSGITPADTTITPRQLEAGRIEVKIPFSSEGAPGVKGAVRLVASPWNVEEA